MKTTLIGSFLILLCFFANAQTMPEAFISQLPNPPGGFCVEGENDAKSAFIQRVGEVHDKLEEEISRRKDEIESKMDANKDKMMQNAIARTGVSPELMQQMMALEKQSKGATGDQEKAYKAQKKALADQMMQQSANISMAEVENLKKMDKAGKTAWAEAYATEKKAEVMADPQAYQQKAATDMKDYKLVEKQRQLADSLGAQSMKYMKQFEDLEMDKTAQDLLTQIDELEAKLNEEYSKENRENDNAIKTYTNQIRDIQISYCNMQTPKYLDILSKYKSFTQASLTPYYRLEKLTNQVNATQTGVKINTEPGLMGLQQVMAYLSKLSDVYRYNHIRPKYVYIGAE
jgi:hypothetical protein